MNFEHSRKMASFALAALVLAGCGGDGTVAGGSYITISPDEICLNPGDSRRVNVDVWGLAQDFELYLTDVSPAWATEEVSVPESIRTEDLEASFTVRTYPDSEPGIYEFNYEVDDSFIDGDIDITVTVSESCS